MATVQSASRGNLPPHRANEKLLQKLQQIILSANSGSDVTRVTCCHCHADTITTAHQQVTAGHSPHFLLNLMPTRDGICNKPSDGDISGVWSWSPWCTCRKGSPRTRPRRRTPAGAAQPCTARGRHIL